MKEYEKGAKDMKEKIISFLEDNARKYITSVPQYTLDVMQAVSLIREL